MLELVIIIVIAVIVFSLFGGQRKLAAAHHEAQTDAGSDRALSEAGGDDADDDDPQIPIALAEFRRRVREVATEHRAVLARKYEQTIYKDEYGTYVFDDWYAEIARFADRTLMIDIGNLKLALSEEENEIWADDDEAIVRQVEPIICEVLEEYSEIGGGAHERNFDLEDPIAYERDVARVLSDAGWNTRLTKASGDQGSDVIAERGGRRAVIQCKLYSQPVGNSAVQEVIAAREFEKAQLAAVVTNNSYTKSARQLAATASVLLLHHSELPNALEEEGSAQSGPGHSVEESVKSGEDPRAAVERMMAEAETTVGKFLNLSSLSDSDFDRLALQGTSALESVHAVLRASAIITFINGMTSMLAKQDTENSKEAAPLKELIDRWRDAGEATPEKFEEFRRYLHKWSQRYPEVITDSNSLRDEFDKRVWSDLFGDYVKRHQDLSRALAACRASRQSQRRQI